MRPQIDAEGIRGSEGDVEQSKPIEISRESNYLNESIDSDDSVFGPENDTLVSPTSEKSYH